jgi:hypothetical protein
MSGMLRANKTGGAARKAAVGGRVRSYSLTAGSSSGSDSDDGE